ncbi:MAG TPA: DUF2520 domain-containing protein [Actinomycetota bacterium]|nr:DUF2520 domain-containing protein [Actinomycetota bacterium]
MAIVGAGRVATALGVLLERAGHRVLVASGRQGSRDRAARHLPHVPFVPLDRAAERTPEAEAVLLGVSDDHVAPVCRALCQAGGVRPGQFVLHLSGSLGLEALAPAEALGAEVLSLHPLQSFPTVERGVERFPGSGAAVTARTERGFAFGEALARDVGGVPFRLEDGLKPLYHAAAVFAANYLVTVEAVAERLFRLAGLTHPAPLFAPLARAVLDRALAEGPAAALTGPAVRGDTGTVRRNLEALAARAPEVVPAYVALARLAAGVAHGAGHLSEEGRARVEEALASWG